MKNRIQLIEELEEIQYNIRATERKIAIKLEESTHFIFFGNNPKFEHDKEIQNKCLAYWKKRFNRTLLKLSYKL